MRAIGAASSNGGFMRKVLGLLLLFGLLAVIPAKAAEVYQQNLSQWKGQVKEITGREYKFLVAPEKVNADVTKAFKEIWDQAKDVAATLNIRMTENKKDPFALAPTIKTYFDTPDFALWQKGFLIRVTTNYQRGYPASPLRVSVKGINGSFSKVLATKLEAKGVKSSSNAEDNIGIGKGGQLVSYVDKAVNFSLTRGELGQMNLADFGAYVPELLKLGLPADTKLTAYVAYGVRCRPGQMELPGLDKPLSVSMEAWSRTEGGAPFVYDFSFGYDGDFTKQIEAHKAGEKLMQALYAQLGEKLAMKDVHKWIGSKVRVLLNKPL